MVKRDFTKAKKRVANKVRALRLSRGWSQEQCAHELNLATAYIVRVERGVVNITLRNLCNIAHGFGVDVAELLSN